MKATMPEYANIYNVKYIYFLTWNILIDQLLQYKAYFL
jgi:hypothetical protein